MSVLCLLQCLLLVLCPGDVIGQLKAAPPTCPGDIFIFICDIIGDQTGITIWRVGGSSECSLIHRSTSSSICGPSDTFVARSGTGFGTSATSYSSTLSGTATPALDGILVECFGPDNIVDPRNRIGNSTLRILGPPSVPTLSCVDISGDVSGAVNVTVSWTLSGGNSADFYLININTNAPQTPYGGLLNISTASVTQYELTGFMTGYEYSITVRGVNCENQAGDESEPLTIKTQVPVAPRSCNITLLYNLSSRRLQFIDTTWDLMLNVVDPQEVCRGLSRVFMRYRIRFQIGLVETYVNVNPTACAAGKCSNIFNLPSDSVFSSYVSVSVAAENVIGVGPARTCTTQTISATNNLLTGEVIDLNSPNDVTIGCIFLSGFNGSARCRVQYGTDPTYSNLPYSAVSTEMGTAGDFITVILRERLNSSSVYYYTVSAVSGDVTVTVRRTFATPQYRCNEADLIDQDGIRNTASCADRGFVNSAFISDGVVCYNGTTRADYICNDGFVLGGNEATRVCQSDGMWNGSIPQCIPEGSDQIGSTVGGVVGGVGGALLIVSIMIFFIIHLRCIIYKMGSRELNEEPAQVEGVLRESIPLLPSKGTEKSLHIAARRGNLGQLKTLVREDPDINIQDNNGMTPLHVAAEEGKHGIVGYLVRKGADINIKDRKGRTPLHIAAREGHEHTLKHIVDNGAVIDIRDYDGESPLDVAEKKGHKKIAEYLQRAGMLDKKERRRQTEQGWFFIMSKLGNNLVMDVAFCRTTPRTQVISYTQKSPPRPNQLWRKEHHDKNTFYLVSKLHPSCKITIKGGNARIDSSGSLFREEGDGEFITLIDKNDNALDVRGASTAPDTPIIALPMSGNTNQKWKYSIPKPFIFQNTDDYFIIESTIGVEMVIDVEHSNPDPGTRVISYCQNDPELMHNQLWRKEWDGENTFYLVSKLGFDCKMTILDANAVIDTSGTLFEEEKSDGGLVILIQSGTYQVLHVDDGYSCTRITAVAKNGSANQKWVIKKHTVV